MTPREKLIWAAAFVAELNKQECNNRSFAMSAVRNRADEAVRFFRECVAAVRQHPDSADAGSLILEFTERKPPTNQAGCRNCRAVAFKDGQCLGCGTRLTQS
jgi:hypothetical protein